MGTPSSKQLDWFANTIHALNDNVSQVVRGKRDQIDLILVSIVAGGHVLIEDVPGTGKTTLAKAIAASIDGKFRRIQFTPDLLPTDVTGSQILNPASVELEFRPGPVFGNVVLADEINRASPKTQAALLEVMEERQHTVDSECHPMPEPFFVIATQNPVELSGTYRLPEAQLDRFLIRTSLGYLDPEDEVLVLGDDDGSAIGVDDLTPVIDAAYVPEMRRIAERVYTAPEVLRYAVDLAAATRSHPDLTLGVSTRGAKGLVALGKAGAASAGRDYVTDEDVRTVVTSAFGHRLVLDTAAFLRSPDLTPQQQIANVLDDVIGSVRPAVARV